MDDETRCNAILGMTNYISLSDFDEILECVGCFCSKSKDEFASISYSKWTANEILYRIETDNENSTPLNIVLDFIDEMEKYSLSSCSEKESLKFSIAHDTAIEIYDYLYFDWYRHANMF